MQAHAAHIQTAASSVLPVEGGFRKEELKKKCSVHREGPHCHVLVRGEEMRAGKEAT